MAEKVFLHREKAIPNAKTASVSRTDIPSTSRKIPVSEDLQFFILEETSKTFKEFNATGRSLLHKYNSPREEQNPTIYLKECIIAFTNYLVDDIQDRDFFGLRIRKTENVHDIVVGIIL